MASTSQSVARTIELFRLFAEERRALTTVDIAERLKMPRSSCAALLKTLFDLNMISTDRRNSSYFPTAEFAELGAWLNASSLYPESLLAALDKLALATHETITLAAYNDLMLELVYVNKSRQAISFSAERGQKFPIWGSALGTAYLTRLDTPQIKALHRRSVDRKIISEEDTPLDKILSDVEEARRHGYAFAKGAVFPDASAITRDTGIENNGRPLIVAIAGPTNRLEKHVEEFGELLISTLSPR